VGRKSAVKRDREITKLKQDITNSKNAINSLSDSIGSMQEIGRLRTEAISDIADRLMVVENLLQPVLNDITIIKRSNFDYKISLLSKGLDDAQKNINKLQNTAWSRFCRWISGK